MPMTDKAEKPEQEQTSEAKARHHYRMRHDWNNLIDDLFEEGMKEGVFDNLPGKGKPLQLKRNPYAPEMELAHSLLKRNDLKPAWITARNDLLKEIETLRAGIKQKWIIHEREFRLAQGKGQRDALIISWDDACQGWDVQITVLNKKIELFNLKRPGDNLELLKLTLIRELERAGARRGLS